jgi:hypothetical protein
MSLFEFATAEGVVVTLDGAPVTLRYTLGASKRIDSQFGDFVSAMRRVTNFNFESFPKVVAAGLDKSPQEVEAAVFAAGMDSLLKPLSEYLSWLCNGGREPNPVAMPDAPGNA